VRIRVAKADPKSKNAPRSKHVLLNGEFVLSHDAAASI
jgi:hypothetical protein